jgi:Tfp pilus assembly protein PilF
MKIARRVGRLSPVLAFAAALALSPSRGHAQTTTFRGSVVDEQGQPVAGAQVEMEYLGETRTKIVKKTTTDKKGGFIRMGMQSGRWKIVVLKEGFRPHGLETSISAGEMSEIPPIQLQAAAGAAAAGLPVTPAAASPAGPDLNATYAKALEALKAGRDTEAETLFKQVLEHAPDAAPVHFNLGLLYLKRKDRPAAEAAFRKAIELRPQEANAYLALATLLADGGGIEGAFSLLQGAAGSFGDNAIYQFALGVAAINAGHESEAQPALARAAELDPQSPEPFYYLGTLAMGRNEIPTAVAHLEKYLALAPQGPNAEVSRKLLAALKTSK